MQGILSARLLVPALYVSLFVQHDEALIPDVTAMMMVAKSTGDMNVLTRILISEHEKLFPVVEGESPVFGLQDYDR